MKKKLLLRTKRRRIRRLWLTVNLGLQQRLGFSLIEVSLAIIVVSTVLVTGISSTLSALNLQLEGDRLALAMSLAQTKMAELRSEANLSATDDSGEIVDQEDAYFGYKWQTSIREENINLSEVLESGGEGPLFDDGLLPDSVQNQAEQRDKGVEGSSKSFFSLGDIPILRITVSVEYPKGGGIYGKYNVETLQRSQRTRIYQRQ